ncbi:MAG: TonB-dependent receptor [Methylococcales bacterium]|nr:TonB-dependent receptor [Methylococcales bacterium]
MKKSVQGLTPLMGLLILTNVYAEDKQAVELDIIEVIGASPIQAGGISIDKIPANVQTVSAEELQKAQSLSMADYMNRYMGSVNINDAQNNPFQPDIQYRGFTASPLMGLPQGLAVYVNGIRFNEPFGDTVQWDLIPEGAIDSMALQPASNPAFGLNSLGGSITVNTKTGFSAPGHHFEAIGGSWDRHSEEIISGWNNGTFGYFVDAKYFSEEGWRDHSRSEVQQGLSTLSWRTNDSSLDLTLAAADNELRGNGAVPEELLKKDHKAVFTHPDITRNRMLLASLDGSTWLNEHSELSGNMYFRRNKIRTYNGDGSEFEECSEPGNAGLLCEETITGGEEVLEDIDGNLVPVDDAFDGGTINTSETKQHSFGFALQTAFDYQLFNHDNYFLVGSSFDRGKVKYKADTELGELTNNRGVDPSGTLLEDSRVRLDTKTDTYSFYLTDTFSVTDKLDVTVSARYNHTRIEMDDKYGTELNGTHTYDRINPAAGFTYAFMPELTVYGNYSEATRVPTPMELSCANPDAPCKLPNAFVSDPPLDQVVATTWEAGFRGQFDNLLDGSLNWNVGVFHTINDDDIIFQSTSAGATNAGYFDNIGKTRRQGIEVGLSTNFFERWRISTNYSYIDAEYRTAFKSNSPSNPESDANGDIQVERGDDIPGIPNHLFKFATDFDVLPEWTIGMDMIYNGSQYLRGDEANLNSKLGDYMVFNLNTEYRFNKHITIFGKLDNVFDRRYKNFGTYGETGDVLAGIGLPENEEARFVGIGAPRAGWVGIRLSL